MGRARMVLAAAAVAVGALGVGAPGAGAATTFGADLSITPLNSNGTLSIVTVIGPGGSATGSPVSGVLVSVRIRTRGAAGAGVFRILRQTGMPDAGTYTMLNTDPEVPFTVTADAGPTGHITETLTRRPILAGDRIGINLNDPTMMVLSSYNDITGQCAFTSPTHGIGVSQDYGTGSCNNNILLVSGTVEPDADGDGYGDESQDACPADVTKQAAPCVATQPPNTTTPKKKCKKKPKKKSAAAAKKCKKKKKK